MTVLGPLGDVTAFEMFRSTKSILLPRPLLRPRWAGVLKMCGVRVEAVTPGVIDIGMASFATTEQGRSLVLAAAARSACGMPRRAKTRRPDHSGSILSLDATFGMAVSSLSGTSAITVPLGAFTRLNIGSPLFLSLAATISAMGWNGVTVTS